ncbi:sigma-54-dependent transcriptional regulator [Idiomarina xiamenensis]|uniref:Response regulator n=1 Tax=Idiomarina xiamenensis 10-D-4 TaxID=740709 RepID=K2KR07_9GAMM|nr:sigma-54 dependent transcriptional regulator [Idiomarina xiamenensis]EKE79935.1 response regulator [Idiomarina xiamenensis 10-D-4]
MSRQCQIAVVEDDPGLRELLLEELDAEGYTCVGFESAEAFLQSDSLAPIDLLVSDIRLPGISGMQLLQQVKQRKTAPAMLLITAFGTVNQAVDALKHGADDFLTKPLDMEHLLLSVKRLLEHRALRAEVSRYRQLQQDGPAGLIGRSRLMRQLYRQIEQVAAADGSVLVLGESGTGKELVARAIHELSARRQQPFLAVNCAGIPAELMESEFFGHAAGAFTGASQARAGLLKQADGGTLLLDEIGEMPLPLQAKLLRVLQEGRLRAVGSDQEISVDVRIVAATHQNLEQQVAAKVFREDLFYRLETFSLAVPPLRQRGDDIELLAHHFLTQLREQQGKIVSQFSPAALDKLYRYRFPGNVRELQNAVERAYTFTETDTIDVEHLPSRMLEASVSEAALNDTTESASSDHWPTMQQVQDDYVAKVMAHTRGNKAQAADILGVTRRTLYRWLDQDD